MKYFSYGSNMSLARLRARVPSAQLVGVFTLKGHSLKFHKIGKDGSAKCNAYFTGSDEDIVEGVVFEINSDEVARLDKAEGLGNGYEKKHVTVTNSQDYQLKALTYYATKIDDKLLPFSWYKNHVLRGAKSAGINEKYTANIVQVKTIKDPDLKREQKELSIYE